MVAVEHERRSPAAATVADAIPVAARRRTASPRRVFATCAIGALVLAFLAAPDLPDWGDQLRDGPATATLRHLADTWADEVARLGSGAPHHALRHEVQRLLAEQWSGLVP